MTPGGFDPFDDLSVSLVHALTIKMCDGVAHAQPSRPRRVPSVDVDHHYAVTALWRVREGDSDGCTGRVERHAADKRAAEVGVCQADGEHRY